MLYRRRYNIETVLLSSKIGAERGVTRGVVDSQVPDAVGSGLNWTATMMATAAQANDFALHRVLLGNETIGDKGHRCKNWNGDHHHCRIASRSHIELEVLESEGCVLAPIGSMCS
jgi:hypothetical protein